MIKAIIYTFEKWPTPHNVKHSRRDMHRPRPTRAGSISARGVGWEQASLFWGPTAPIEMTQVWPVWQPCLSFADASSSPSWILWREMTGETLRAKVVVAKTPWCPRQLGQTPVVVHREAEVLLTASLAGCLIPMRRPQTPSSLVAKAVCSQQGLSSLSGSAAQRGSLWRDGRH